MITDHPALAARGSLTRPCDGVHPGDAQRATRAKRAPAPSATRGFGEKERALPKTRKEGNNEKGASRSQKRGGEVSLTANAPLSH